MTMSPDYTYISLNFVVKFNLFVTIFKTKSLFQLIECSLECNHPLPVGGVVCGGRGCVALVCLMTSYLKVYNRRATDMSRPFFSFQISDWIVNPPLNITTGGYI